MMKWRTELKQHFIDSAKDWMNHSIADTSNYSAVGHGFDYVVFLRNCRRGRWTVQEMMEELPGWFEAICKVWEDWIGSWREQSWREQLQEKVYNTVVPSVIWDGVWYWEKIISVRRKQGSFFLACTSQYEIETHGQKAWEELL